MYQHLMELVLTATVGKYYVLSRYVDDVLGLYL